MAGGAELGREAEGHRWCFVHPVGTGFVSHGRRTPAASARRPPATDLGSEVHVLALNSPSVSLLSPCHINYHSPLPGPENNLHCISAN